MFDQLNLTLLPVSAVSGGSVQITRYVTAIQFLLHGVLTIGNMLISCKLPIIDIPVVRF